MQHQIPAADLGARGEAMARAVQTCVHCGFCLPTCPTYQVLGQEMDSPRGRIFLMKEVLEGKLDAAEAQPHIDRCLGCLACQTHCPSGVQYGELLSPYRAMRRDQGEIGGDRWQRWLAAITLPYPRRFRLAMWSGRLGKMFRFAVPKRLRPMIDLVPDSLPSAVRLPAITPAVGERRARVALLAGCAQQVLAPEINVAAIEVLSRNGVEVLVPQSQGCCGALSWHIGDARRAMQFATNNIKAFPKDVDAVVTTAAGCGSAIHEYPLILKGTEAAGAAEELAHRSLDVCEFMERLGGLVTPPALRSPLKVAYHDACHLSHGQKVRSSPRRLLQQIPGLELVELAETELCCGSAGTYNMDQPEIAAELGRMKAQHVIDTGPLCWRSETSVVWYRSVNISNSWARGCRCCIRLKSYGELIKTRCNDPPGCAYSSTDC